MDKTSNAGAATPQSLYDMYAKSAAVSGNPCTMRSLTSERAVVAAVGERATFEERQPLLYGLRPLGAMFNNNNGPAAPAAAAAAGDLEAGRATLGPQTAGGRSVARPAAGRSRIACDPTIAHRLSAAQLGSWMPAGAGHLQGASIAIHRPLGTSQAELAIRQAVRHAQAVGYMTQQEAAPRRRDMVPRAYSR